MLQDICFNALGKETTRSEDKFTETYLFDADNEPQTCASGRICSLFRLSLVFLFASKIDFFQIEKSFLDVF